MKLLYFAQFVNEQTNDQRATCFEQNGTVQVIRCAEPLAPAGADLRGLVHRLSRKTGWPTDLERANATLLKAVEAHSPDAIFVDNCRLLRRETIAEIRRKGAKTVYYSPDDVMAYHNRTGWFLRSLPDWDIIYTTKSFNVAELRAAGASRVELVPNTYFPDFHRPLGREEVGPEYEHFDVVFVGTFERQRARSLVRLSRAGLSVLVAGDAAGRIAGGWNRVRHHGIEVRPSASGREYSRVIHCGKIALGFLRKINRDQITQRSIEIPAMARPFVAERTAEHDAAFDHENEYVGFRNDEELLLRVRALLADSGERRRLGRNARARTLASDWEVFQLTERMVEQIRGL